MILEGINMLQVRPKYITFDCYGTLISFQMSKAAARIYAGQLDEDQLRQFNHDFTAYRRDEVLGDWKPYRDVIVSALERACVKNKVKFHIKDGESIYRQVPTWGPHPDVTAGLTGIAKEIPLVILSNASDDQIAANVESLGVPFHAVYTAQQAQAYKPRLRAFEYLLDMLGCAPDEILHVSSSFRYDLLSATDLGIKNKVWVNRGHEHAVPGCGYFEIADISGLPGVIGL